MLPKKRYECLFCQHQFRWNRDLESHMNIHTRERPYSCDQCDSTFISCSSLGFHKKNAHLGVYYQCNLCNRKFRCSAGLKFHCHKFHKSKSKPSNGKRTRAKTPAQSVIYKTGNKGQLRRGQHNAKKILDRRKVSWNKAEKSEEIVNNFKQEIPLFKCETQSTLPNNSVSVAYQYQTLLQSVLVEQMNNQKWANSYFMHMNRYNPEDSIFSQKLVKNAIKSIKNVEKTVLVKPKKPTTTAVKLEKDSTAQVIVLPERKKGRPPKVKTEENENLAQVKQEVIPVKEVETVESSNDNVKCPYCPKVLIYHNLKAHLLIHTGEKPFKCQFCTLRFRQKNHMIQHIARYHRYGRNLGIPGKPKSIENIVEDAGDISCAFCGDLFNAKAFLQQHLLREHNEKLQAETT